MNEKKLVIFDFDGVIINTLQFQYGLNQDLNPHLGYELYKDMSNGNFWDSFQGENAITTLNPNPLFRELYHEKVRDFDTPIEIQEFIKNNSNKYTLAIVSSGSEDSMRHFLEKEALFPYFSDILGYQTHKNKVVKIKDCWISTLLIPVMRYLLPTPWAIYEKAQRQILEVSG